MKKLIPALIFGALLIPGAEGSITTYTTRATFENALSAPTTFDFNQPNGPVSVLGTVLGISTIGGNPNGEVDNNTLYGSDGGGINSFLPVQFTFLTPGFAFGYDNLDFTDNEEAVITFSFVSGGPSQQFTISLSGQPAFMPVFFGATSTDEIANVQIYSRTIGTDEVGLRANIIDNVTVGEVADVTTPEPSSMMLMSGGLLLLLGRCLRPRTGLARK